MLLRSLLKSFFLASFLVVVTGVNSSMARQQVNANPAVDQDATSSVPTLEPPAVLVISGPADPQDPASSKSAGSPSSDNTSASKPDSPQPKINDVGHTDPQTKRILWIIPNFRSVSADTQLYITA